MYSLTSTKKYDDDVKKSIKYIRNNLQNPVASQRLKDDIKNAYQKLKENPFIYPKVPDKFLASKGFRFIIVKKYIIFYIVEGNIVNVIRFLYGPRNWINILKDDI